MDNKLKKLLMTYIKEILEELYFNNNIKSIIIIAKMLINIMIKYNRIKQKMTLLKEIKYLLIMTFLKLKIHLKIAHTKIKKLW